MLGRAGWTRSGLALTLRAPKGPSETLDLQEHGHSQQEDFPSAHLPCSGAVPPLGHQAGHQKQTPPHIPRHDQHRPEGDLLYTGDTAQRGTHPWVLTVLENLGVKAGDTSQLAQSTGPFPPMAPAAPTSSLAME